MEPSALLSQLNRALLELDGALLVEGSTDDEAALLEILRRVYLLQSTSDLYLVTVAGVQGAGKTTLVREIYGLPPQEMEGNLGQGERMPIAVIENTDVHKPRKWVRRLDDTRGEIRQEVVSDAVWENATRGLDARVLVAGLDVPANFFGVSGAGFLLLPGYESLEPTNEVWQARMRGALMSSPACIVVTDRDGLASADQDSVLSDLRRSFLDKVNPVICVSHGEDLLLGGDSSSIVSTVLSVFGEGFTAEDVIVTGVDEDTRSVWRNQLRTRLMTGLEVRSGFRRQQLHSLKKTVSIDLKNLLDEIKRKLAIEEKLPGDGEYVAWLMAYDDSAAIARRDFEFEVLRLLEAQSSRAVQLVDAHLEDHVGVKSSLAKIGEWVQGKSDLRKRSRDTRVLGYWDDSMASPKESSDAIERVQAALVSRSLASTNESDHLGGPAISSADSATKNPQVRPSPLVIPGDVSDGLVFISGQAPEMQQPPDKDFMPSVRLLPGVGLESLLFRLDVAQLATEAGAGENSPPTVDQAVSVLNQINDNRRLLLRGLVLFVGADMIVDGVDPSIPDLAAGVSNFLFGTSAPAGAAALVSTTIAVGMIAAAAGGAIIAAANRDAANERQTAYAIVQGAHDQAFVSMMSQYDQIMQYLRDRLAARMRGHLRVDEELSRQLNLRKAVVDAESARADVLKSIGKRLELD